MRNIPFWRKNSSGVGELEMQGVQAHPQKFQFVKDLGKISGNFGKEVLTFFNNINDILLLRY